MDNFVSVLTVDALVVEKEITISFPNELIPINNIQKYCMAILDNGHITFEEYLF